MMPRGRPTWGCWRVFMLLTAVFVGVASARRGRRGLGTTIKQGPLVAVSWGYSWFGDTLQNQQDTRRPGVQSPVSGDAWVLMGVLESESTNWSWRKGRGCYTLQAPLCWFGVGKMSRCLLVAEQESLRTPTCLEMLPLHPPSPRVAKCVHTTISRLSSG